MSNHISPVALPRRLPRHELGASLLEGIAYLGIAAIVVLGAVSLLTNAFGTAKSNQMNEEVVSLRTMVRKLYAGQPYNNGTMMNNLVAANAIPNTLVLGGTSASPTVSNTWAGSVTTTGTGVSTFEIKYTSVPRDVCMGVVSGATGWTKISNGTDDATTFPVPATSAATICKTDPVDLTFTST